MSTKKGFILFMLLLISGLLTDCQIQWIKSTVDAALVLYVLWLIVTASVQN